MHPRNWAQLTKHVQTVSRDRHATALAAGAYAEIGLHVFPLYWVQRTEGVMACACAAGLFCGSPGKHPLNSNGVSGATADLKKVTAWWRAWPQANIGLAANHSYLCMIDVDPRHGGDASLETLAAWCEARGTDITETLTVRTPSGGIHYYYRCPPGGIKTAARTFGAKGVGLDTRGVGGYVVAPPSIGVGGAYEFLDGSGPPAEWPECLSWAIQHAYPERLGQSPLAEHTPTPPPTNRGEGWGAAALLGECKEVAACQEGGRNARLNAAAYKVGRVVGGGYLNVETAFAALAKAARDCKLPPDEAGRTITSGLRAGQKNPRHPAPVAAL